MSKRGGFRGGVKPRLSDNLKRQSLSCRVKPETKVYLGLIKDETYQSVGELVDTAVELLKEQVSVKLESMQIE